MFVATVISLLAVLDITTGQYQQQVPVCMPVAGFSSKNCGKDEKLVSRCPLISFHLPRDNQVSDYIRYRNYVPKMSSATVCSWIETTDFNDGFLASYAIRRTDNAYLLGFRNSTWPIVYIMGDDYRNQVPQTARPLDDTDKFHLCHWFSRKTKTSGIYINGKSIVTFGYSGAVVAGGGDFILGQEQDAINAGSLNAAQALQGNITNFMIWPRVLTASEIDDIAKNCQCPIDHSIVFSLDRVELFGQASYSIPETCPTL